MKNKFLRQTLLDHGEDIDINKEKDIIEKILRSSRETIWKKVTEENTQRRIQVLESRNKYTREEREELAKQVQTEEQEKFVNLLLDNYNDHTLRCGILTVADKKIKVDAEYLNKFISYQMEYFSIRNISPTTSQIGIFNKAIHNLSNIIFKYFVAKQKLKLTYFTKWYSETFGLRRELNAVTKLFLDSELKENSKKALILEQFFSFRNKERFYRTTRQAFVKWKLMVEYNYPLYSRKHNKVMGMIPKKILEYNTLVKQKNNNLKSSSWDRGVYPTKKKPFAELKSSEFYSRLTTGLYALKRATNRQFEYFFTAQGVIDFPHQNKNIEILKRKVVSSESNGRDFKRVSYLVPTFLAQQVFIFSYKRALISALKRLQSQVKITQMNEQLTQIHDRINSFRDRARAELFIKLYIRLIQRQASRFFTRWKYQTEIRKFAGKKEVKEKKGVGSKEREVYERMKKVVEDLSEKYATTMSQIVVNNIKRDSDIVIGLINEDLEKMMVELMDYI